MRIVRPRTPGVSAERALPEAVAEHRERAGRLPLFLGGEQPPDDGPHAERRRQDLGGHRGSRHALGLRARDEIGVGGGEYAPSALNDVCAFKSRKFGGDSSSAVVRGAVPDRDERSGSAYGSGRRNT